MSPVKTAMTLRIRLPTEVERLVMVSLCKACDRTSPASCAPQRQAGTSSAPFSHRRHRRSPESSCPWPPEGLSVSGPYSSMSGFCGFCAPDERGQRPPDPDFRRGLADRLQRPVRRQGRPLDVGRASGVSSGRGVASTFAADSVRPAASRCSSAAVQWSAGSRASPSRSTATPTPNPAATRTATPTRPASSLDAQGARGSRPPMAPRSPHPPAPTRRRRPSRSRRRPSM